MNKLKIAIIDIIGIPYDGTTVFKQGLGGSESAVTLVSKELNDIGFDVTVFNHCNVDHARPGVYDGVLYRPLEDLAQDHTFDIIISSRTVIPFTDPSRYDALRDNRAWAYHGLNLYDRILSKAKMRVLWMHDTFCLGDTLIEELALQNRITDIFTLSDWHLTYIANCDHGARRNFEVLKRKLFITRNGARNYIPEVDINAKDKNLFVYNASVTKGMVPLVEHIWPRIKQQIPQAQLKVIGGYYRFSSGDQPDEQEKKWRQMADDPSNTVRGIEFTGIIPQFEIAQILAKANFMIYPAAFPETFGISSLESMMYNTPLITCRFGALEEIALEEANYLIDYAIEPNGLFPNINAQHQQNVFVDAVLRAYHNPYLHQQKQYYCNIVKDVCGWDAVAKQWKQHFYKQTGNYLSLAEYREISKINHRIHKIWKRRYHNVIELETYKSGQEQEIIVLSPFWNCAQYIERCIESVSVQDYDNYRHILIDDCSTDNTYDVAKAAIDRLPEHIRKKYTLIRNTENKGAVRNQVETIRSLTNENAIVMLLDGDDSLINDNTIFSHYNTVFDDSVEFSYGSCWSMVDNIPLISQPYPEHVKQNRDYRQHHFNWILPYTHLRTFRKHLINQCPDQMFQDGEGTWFKAGGDGSLFYALIESAEPNKVKCFQDVVYNYNDVNPLNDYKINGDEQNRTAREIISKKHIAKYSLVVPTMWKLADQFVQFLGQLVKHPAVDEIIIINNDNTKTPKGLDHPKIQMLDLDKNIFVNPAWNMGVRKSKNNRLCILNDDITFDLNIFEKLQDLLTPEAGLFGLCPGEPDFDQVPVTDKKIDIIPWTGQHTYGYGCLMFLHKSIWEDIPDGLKIYFGDNFIFDLQLAKNKTNYIIANMEFYTPFAQTTGDKNLTEGVLEQERPIYDNIKKNMMNRNLLQEVFEQACVSQSDIKAHLPTLKALADECETITEFGVRDGFSTKAFLASNAKLRSFDLYLNPLIAELFEHGKRAGKDIDFQAANTLHIEIEETDMLFIDTEHSYRQLKAELLLHGDKAKKYIVLHDTQMYGLKSEANIDDEKGLLNALIEYMIDKPEWKFKHISRDDSGLLVIERQKPTTAINVPQVIEYKPIAIPEAAKKRILCAIPTARNIEVDTFKSIYDLEIPEGYTMEFQYFFGYNIDQVRNLIAHWAIHYDYLFSVDSDIAFEKDTLKKLLSHDKDVVSGLYIQRIPNTHTLELYENNEFGGVSNIPYEKIKDRGLVEIAACGFGCVLVKSEVFRAVGYPQFEYHSALDHSNTISEDTDFCRKAKSKGFRIFADTSIQCRHIGNWIFKVDNNIQAVAFSEKDLLQRYRTLYELKPLSEPQLRYLQEIKLSGENPQVIYDIGSCVLHWSNMAKAVWNKSRFIMFDAIKELAPLYNELNLEHYICLLSDRNDREVDFYKNDFDPGGSSYYRENPEFSPAADRLFPEHFKVKLQARTLDSIIKEKNLPMPDLIKMDIQGSELDVLKGADEVLLHVKHIILELQKVEYNKGAPLAQEVINYLEAKGFENKGMFSDNGADGDYHFVKKS